MLVIRRKLSIMECDNNISSEYTEKTWNLTAETQRSKTEFPYTSLKIFSAFFATLR